MYNTIPTLTLVSENGGVTDSIASEPNNKHTAEGKTALSTLHLNINADNNAQYALAA